MSKIWADPMLAVVVLAALFFVFTVLSVHPKRNTYLEVLVGAGAALDFFQIANVHLFTLFTAAWVIFGQRRPLSPPTTPTLAIASCALLLAGTTFTGDLIVSHTLALQLVAFAGTACIIGMKADELAIQRMLRGFLAVSVFASLFAIGQKAGLLPLREFNAVDSEGRVMGIYREPDWLGLFAAAGIVVALGIDVPRWQKLPCILVLGAAMALSLARAQYVGLVAVGTLSLLVSLRHGQIRANRRNRGVLVSAAVLGALALALSATTRETLVDRAETAIGVKQDTGAQARFHQKDGLLALARNEPWYGHGLGAAGRVDVKGVVHYSGPINNTVATDWVLGWWIDGGLFAVPLIVALVTLALATIETTAGKLLTLVLVTSIVSNSTMFPIAWFSVGICLAYWRPSLAGARQRLRAPARRARAVPQTHVTPTGYPS